MLNELTERNMDAWKSMQRGFLDVATQTNPANPANRPGPKKPG
jgi:hypothetical protein